VTDKTDWRVAMQMLQTGAKADAVQSMQLVLYRVLAAAELNAPASAKGAFIPVGNSFDAFASLAKVLQTATRDALIVDPYMDEAVLTEFGGTVPSGVIFRLLSDHATYKPTLHTAATKWVTKYGVARPLHVRLAPPKALHDRAIFIDQTTAWTITQSFKDLAKRSPAEIVRADDTAALKITAYEAIWATARVIV
jgi:hypothetical protein